MFKKRQKEQLLQIVHGNKEKKYLKHKWLDQESNLGSLWISKYMYECRPFAQTYYLPPSFNNLSPKETQIQPPMT